MRISTSSILVGIIFIQDVNGLDLVYLNELIVNWLALIIGFSLHLTLVYGSSVRLHGHGFYMLKDMVCNGRVH